MTAFAPDPEPPSDSAPTLGCRLRDRRKALGLTLAQVADSAGLTAGFISQIERDLATPSLTSLTNVARVLDLDPAAFLARPPDPGAATRQGTRPLWGLDPQTLGYERISSTFPGNVLRSVIIHEAPGYRTEPMRHEGEELFFILSGALTVEIDGAIHLLGPGDFIHFASTRVHSTWNHTDRPATFLHTCTMDVFGDTPERTPRMTEADFSDALAAGASQPAATLDALGRLAVQVTGARLVTLMTRDPDDGSAERIWTNMPGPYPVAGRKPMNRSHWSDIVIGRHETFVANTIEEIAAVFPDDPLIQSLGCEACMNLPVIVAGQVLGTINCLDAAGYWTAERLALSRPLRLAGAAAFLLHHQMTKGA